MQNTNTNLQKYSIIDISRNNTINFNIFNSPALINLYNKNAPYKLTPSFYNEYSDKGLVELDLDITTQKISIFNKILYIHIKSDSVLHEEDYISVALVNDDYNICIWLKQETQPTDGSEWKFKYIFSILENVHNYKLKIYKNGRKEGNDYSFKEVLTNTKQTGIYSIYYSSNKYGKLIYTKLPSPYSNLHINIAKNKYNLLVIPNNINTDVYYNNQYVKDYIQLDKTVNKQIEIYLIYNDPDNINTKNTFAKYKLIILHLA